VSSPKGRRAWRPCAPARSTSPSLPCRTRQTSPRTRIKVYTGEKRSGQLAYVGFTEKIPPLDDRRVREAVGYALDRDAMLDIGFNGLVQASDCPVAPGLLGFDAKKCAEWGQHYDPERAKALLKEAGYGPDKPLRVELSVSPWQGWDESYVVMQQELKAVGIDAKIETRQFATWVD
jgi:ABC-type transport system substrate-binding protein